MVLAAIIVGLAGGNPTRASAVSFGACLKVSPAYPVQIMSGTEAGVGKVTIKAASAVKSPDYSKVWFVAIRFDVVGGKNLVGVWATNGDPTIAQRTGTTMSVDGFAQQFTVWPDADKTEAAISKADRAVAAAKKCLPKK